MLTKDVYYSEQPEKVYVYPYDGQSMCRADFPVDVQEIETEEGNQYLCNVYSLRTNYANTLPDEIEADYEGWLERAKEYEMPRKRPLLKAVRLTANASILLESSVSETGSFTTFIQLPQTIYGGTLDVVSGELVVDKGYIASYNGETLPSTWISDRDEYASGTTPSIGAEVVYELVTPQTIQLTPTEVRSLLGTNNVWSDGDVDVVYKADIPTDGSVIKYLADGFYRITYKAEDHCGNENEVERIISVPDGAYPMTCYAKTCVTKIAGKRTVIYSDGTMIINELYKDQEANASKHGMVMHVYEPLNEDGTNYVWAWHDDRLWEEAYEEIKSVEIGSVIRPISTANWFYGLRYCTGIDLTNLDSSNTTTMEDMFHNSIRLESVNLEVLDTHNVENFSEFLYETPLTEIDVTRFDTSKATNMERMFYRMPNIEVLDLSSFDTSNVTIMMGMFSSDSKLTTIYVSERFDTSKASTYGDVFWNCPNLVGGQGTAYSADNYGIEYARIDNPPDEPGYFTEKE